jgi:hypothetical protein
MSINELTTEEHNFLRWLFERNKQVKFYDIEITVTLTDYQKELFESIQSKLLGLSSY